MRGCFLCQQKPVDLVTVQRWIKANFDIHVSIGTLSRHKSAMGLSFQLVGRRGMTPGVSRDEYVMGYFEFVQRLHLAQFFDYDPDRIICIDFVTNSQRREYEKSLSILGENRKRFPAVYEQLYRRCVPGWRSGYIVPHVHL